MHQRYRKILTGNSQDPNAVVMEQVVNTFIVFLHINLVCTVMDKFLKEYFGRDRLLLLHSMCRIVFIYMLYFYSIMFYSRIVQQLCFCYPFTVMIHSSIAHFSCSIDTGWMADHLIWRSVYLVSFIFEIINVVAH